MKKILAAALAASMLTISLTGCGTKEVDITKLSNALLNNAQFAEKLTEGNEEITKKRLDIDECDVETCKAYKGTSAVVDELVVIKTSDAEDVEEKLHEYIESQTNLYQKYRPEEVPKLEQAVIYSQNGVVVYCASEDSNKAMQIINDNMS